MTSYPAAYKLTISGADCHGIFPNKLVAPERERAIKVKGAIRVTAPDRKGPKPKGQKLAQP
ncbi:hypothetical protein FEK48_08460 [Escherichia sp. E2593]|nr:hypothetical protein D9738_08495 [Escherichia sp. E10V5]TGC07751.1 hypothetical protein CRG93_15785 [Escherichia sp. E2593]TLI86201.1 hypothetical protein FEK48_08460 [Escherichia sp. E2593]